MKKIILVLVSSFFFSCSYSMNPNSTSVTEQQSKIQRAQVLAALWYVDTPCGPSKVEYYVEAPKKKVGPEKETCSFPGENR